MDKPEALRLAELFEIEADLESLYRQAAAELRRQHGEIKSMRTERLRSERRLSAVEAQRDALLEALRQIVEQHGQWNNGIWAANIARAAIKAVEEGK